MFQRMNSLENESSRERMVPRTKVPSWERMFPGTNSLENEYSSIQLIDQWKLLCILGSKMMICMGDEFDSYDINEHKFTIIRKFTLGR